MFGVLDTSASGLIAQRVRMDVVSANIANQDTIYDQNGNYNPYKRKSPVFQIGDPTANNPLGVHVSKIHEDDAFQLVYQPNHQHADEGGYVRYPNVNPAMEMVDAMEASRAYEANMSAVEATKSMMTQVLQIIA